MRIFRKLTLALFAGALACGLGANGQGFQRLALLEEEKALPWNAVWDMFCLKNNVPVGEDFIAEIEKYEAEVTSKR